MTFRFLGITAAFLMFLSGCCTSPPRWRAEALAALERLNKGGAAAVLPTEYHNTEKTLALGDSFNKSGDDGDAERYYYLALQQADLLEKNLPVVKARIATEKKKLREEAEKRESAERIKALLEEQDRRDAVEKRESRISAEKLRHAKELVLPDSHTVKRGETLPSIAALPEVYDDSGLWPLLYRANRDQVSDPKRIWPGQVLRIPRNVNREEISEAGKYAREKPMP
jgi:nucleoid-associated protein YgaU